MMPMPAYSATVAIRKMKPIHCRDSPICSRMASTTTKTGTTGSMLKVRPTLAFTAREVPVFATALRATLESLGT